MQFNLAPILIFNGYYPSTASGYVLVSDHSRGALDISNERFEKTVQIANGTTRKFVIANKRSLSLQWTDLPTTAEMTVDNGMGAANLQLFYNNNYNNPITAYLFTDNRVTASGTPSSSGMVINSASGGKLTTMPTASSNAQTISMYIESFSCVVKKRHYGGGSASTGYYDLWDASMTLKEI